jgi:serine/threonine protein kinase
VSSIGDATVERLRELVDRPDTSGLRYEIVELIGEGGMGVVYLARDRELERDVALKVLRTPEATPDGVERLTREARILAKLEHPGIVPVHDVGRLADGRVFYVMKRVQGEPLDRIAASRRSIPESLRIVRQVCEAVAFAHQAGVVHRDLKPHNVMLGPFGEVLVVDWGIAKARETGTPTALRGIGAPATSLTTYGGTAAGTPGYMAPEQLAGQSADGRSDVFGIGGILEFLLTGEHPGDDAAVRWGDVPSPLRSICRQARQPDPAARYQTPAQLASEIERYQDGLPVLAHREGPLERLRRVAARHRTAILLVIGYLVMRAALLAWGGR